MSWKGILAFVLAVSGNIFLAWLFWSVPESQGFGAHIIDAGFLVLAAEFLAIYAGGITSGKQVESERSFAGTTLSPVLQKWRVLPALFLILAAMLLAWFIQKPSLAFFFVVSFATKYFGHRAVRSHPMTVINLVWFFLSLVVFVVPESLLETVLQLTGNSPGAMHRLLPWGVVYFGVSAVICTVLSTRELRKIPAHKAIST